MHPAFIPQVDPATVERARRIDDARAATTYVNTPPPVYVSRDQPTFRPQKLALHEVGRIKSAAAAARRTYPGVVGELLAHELNFHAETGWVGDPRGMVARLCAHLLDPPPRDAA